MAEEETRVDFEVNQSGDAGAKLEQLEKQLLRVEAAYKRVEEAAKKSTAAVLLSSKAMEGPGYQGRSGGGSGGGGGSQSGIGTAAILLATAVGRTLAQSSTRGTIPGSPVSGRGPILPGAAFGSISSPSLAGVRPGGSNAYYGTGSAQQVARAFTPPRPIDARVLAGEGQARASHMPPATNPLPTMPMLMQEAKQEDERKKSRQEIPLPVNPLKEAKSEARQEDERKRSRRITMPTETGAVDKDKKGLLGKLGDVFAGIGKDVADRYQRAEGGVLAKILKTVDSLVLSAGKAVATIPGRAKGVAKHLQGEFGTAGGIATGAALLASNAIPVPGLTPVVYAGAKGIRNQYRKYRAGKEAEAHARDFPDESQGAWQQRKYAEAEAANKAGQKPQGLRPGNAGGGAWGGWSQKSQEKQKDFSKLWDNPSSRLEVKPGRVPGQGGGEGPNLLMLFGKAAAGLYLFNSAVNKAGDAASILTNGQLTAAQKSQAMADMFIPGAKGLRMLGEALSGVTEKVRQAELRLSVQSVKIAAEFEAKRTRNEGERQVGSAQAGLSALHAVNYDKQNFYDRGTTAGKIKTEEESQRQQAMMQQKQAERAKWAAVTEQDQVKQIAERPRDDLDRAKKRRDQLERDLLREKRIENGTEVSPEKKKFDKDFGEMPGLVGLATLGGKKTSELINGGKTPERRKAQIAEKSVDFELENKKILEMEAEKQADINRLKESGVKTAQAESALRKANINVLQTEANILKAREDRMASTQQKLGAMTKAEYEFSKAAAQRLKEVGLENATPQLIEAAGRVAPEMLKEFQEKAGAERGAEREKLGIAGEGAQDFKDANLKEVRAKLDVAQVRVRNEIIIDEQKLAREIAGALDGFFKQLIENVKSIQEAKIKAEEIQRNRIINNGEQR